MDNQTNKHQASLDIINEKIPKYNNALGAAKNFAAALDDLGWVMHPDIDQMVRTLELCVKDAYGTRELLTRAIAKNAPMGLVTHN